MSISRAAPNQKPQSGTETVSAGSTQRHRKRQMWYFWRKLRNPQHQIRPPFSKAPRAIEKKSFNASEKEKAIEMVNLDRAA